MIQKRRVRLVPSRMDTPCWWPKDERKPKYRRRVAGGLCWPYSRLSRKLPDGQRMPEIRFMYEQVIGPVPEGKFMHHDCLRPICINPHHAVPVDYSEHMKRHVDLGLRKRPSRAYAFGLTTNPYEELEVA